MMVDVEIYTAQDCHYHTKVTSSFFSEFGDVSNLGENCNNKLTQGVFSVLIYYFFKNYVYMYVTTYWPTN